MGLWLRRMSGLRVARERLAGICGELCLSATLYEVASLRANGSHECAPDDRLREAIQSQKTGLLRRLRSSQSRRRLLKILRLQIARRPEHTTVASAVPS